MLHPDVPGHDRESDEIARVAAQSIQRMTPHDDDPIEWWWIVVALGLVALAAALY